MVEKRGDWIGLSISILFLLSFYWLYLIKLKPNLFDIIASIAFILYIIISFIRSIRWTPILILLLGVYSLLTSQFTNEKFLMISVFPYISISTYVMFFTVVNLLILDNFKNIYVELIGYISYLISFTIDIIYFIFRYGLDSVYIAAYLLLIIPIYYFLIYYMKDGSPLGSYVIGLLINTYVIYYLASLFIGDWLGVYYEGEIGKYILPYLIPVSIIYLYKSTTSKEAKERMDIPSIIVASILTSMILVINMGYIYGNTYVLIKSLALDYGLVYPILILTLYSYEVKKYVGVVGVTLTFLSIYSMFQYLNFNTLNSTLLSLYIIISLFIVGVRRNIRYKYWLLALALILLEILILHIIPINYSEDYINLEVFEGSTKQNDISVKIDSLKIIQMDGDIHPLISFKLWVRGHFIEYEDLDLLWNSTYISSIGFNSIIQTSIKSGIDIIYSIEGIEECVSLHSDIGKCTPNNLGTLRIHSIYVDNLTIVLMINLVFQSLIFVIFLKGFR